MKDAILFQFPDRRSAYYAFDTLEELGYNLNIGGDEQRPSIQVQMDQNDLTSALEIAQSFGGILMNEQSGSDTIMFEVAYHLSDDSIQIPAHLVTEDLTEDYLQGDSFSADVRI